MFKITQDSITKCESRLARDKSELTSADHVLRGSSGNSALTLWKVTVNGW